MSYIEDSLSSGEVIRFGPGGEPAVIAQALHQFPLDVLQLAFGMQAPAHIQSGGLRVFKLDVLAGTMRSGRLEHCSRSRRGVSIGSSNVVISSSLGHGGTSKCFGSTTAAANMRELAGRWCALWRSEL